MFEIYQVLNNINDNKTESPFSKRTLSNKSNMTFLNRFETNQIHIGLLSKLKYKVKIFLEKNK